MSVWVMPSIDVYEYLLISRRQSQTVANGRKRWAPLLNVFQELFPFVCLLYFQLHVVCTL